MTPDDEVMVLGDFAMGRIDETLPVAGVLNGRKVRERMINVGVDVWDFAPVEERMLAELIARGYRTSGLGASSRDGLGQTRTR